jgi:sensor histidine kinase regulating citrate/malate metabolism
MDAVQVSQLMKSSQYELEALNLKVENEQQIRSIHHDMKNHYAALDALLEDGNVAEARDYLRALGRDLQPRKATAGTGNLILDQLLSEKTALAEKEEIAVTVDLDYRQCVFISNVDTVTIFANILDNSIEAASKASNGDRFIRIKGGCKAGCFLCMISNSCTGSPRFVHGIPVTTKKDALSHGYGIRNVQKALAKYSGELNVSAEEGLFSLYLTIPLPAKE